MRRCRRLAEVSEERGRIVRPFASPAMGRANTLVGSWMEDAGLDVHVDAAGNLVGRMPGTGERAETLLLGSHLDTVRDAGAFDGPLGVVVAIAALERLLVAGRRLPFDVEVLGFSDEEGLRYGTAYLGSRAVAGTWDPALLALVDDDGVTLGAALAEFGGDGEAAGALGRDPMGVLGYVEVHIEQGPVLDDAERPVGVVSAIAGATRAQARFVGRSGHAGTVPMDSRLDALAAAAEWVLDVEAAGRATPGLLATVGRLVPHPGATNVIAGSVVASLDVRHPSDAVRVEAVRALRALASERAAARGLTVEWVTRLENAATRMDPALTSVLSQAARDVGVEPGLMPSGAGHDAVALSALTGVAMLFVRCAGGVSHHPDESARPEDVAVAIAVLGGLLERLAAA